jgi:hypothetical protein
MVLVVIATFVLAVAPLIVLPAAERTVLGLAATVTRTDVTALILYGEHAEVRQTPAPMACLVNPVSLGGACTLRFEDAR